MKKIYLLTLLFILAGSLNGQDFRQKINQAVDNRDYAGAINELRNLEKSDKKLFTLNNYDYLTGRMALKRGDLALAMSKFQSVADRESVLRDYALWHMSQIARASGNLVLERVHLRRLMNSDPRSLLHRAVSTRLARSSFESKDYDAAIELFKALISASNPVASGTTTATKPADARTREMQVWLGQAYLQSGKTNEAREIFRQLVDKIPNSAQPDDFALEAVKALDEMEVGKDLFGKTAPELPDTEHARRASIYMFNRSFALARLHYKAIIERHPGSTFTANSIFQTGRSYTRELSFDEAIKWFERAYLEFPENTIAQDALSQSAAAFSRVRKAKEATNRYQKFIAQYPDADNLDRAYLNIVDIHRDLGEDADALKWTAKTREAFKGELPEAIALFSQVRIHISQQDWQNALTDLTELAKMPDLGGTRVPGGTNKAEVAFLTALVLENLNRFEEAITTYLSIPDGRSEYYGWRSTEHLRAMLDNEKTAAAVQQRFGALKLTAEQPLTPANAESVRVVAQSAIRLTNDPTVLSRLLEIVKKAYALIPAYQKVPTGKLAEFGRKEILKATAAPTVDFHRQIADELIFLRLFDEGTPELEISLREKLTKNTNSLNDFPAETAYTLAVFYNRGEISNRAVGYAEPQWRPVPADYQVELLPREQVELLYPVPYADSLIKYGPERKVDPRFALSIMRQESRYRADVKSVAAARGLMQFISDTSNTIAKELGRKNFRQDELYDPPTAVLFGSQYLGNLLKLFPDQLPAVAASYNGGEHNMSRWLLRAKSESPDRYLPEVVFSESKDYVYKVMANYRVYRAFYDEQLKSRVSVNSR